jgi:integrase/recombinase XerD
MPSCSILRCRFAASATQSSKVRLRRSPSKAPAPCSRSIKASNLVGLRDRAIVAILIYTAARAGAVAILRCGSLYDSGEQWMLHFDEKGGKSREIPVRHDLEQMVFEYIEAAGIRDGGKDTPLFRTAHRKTGTLTENSMSGVDVLRMVKRRLCDAGLPARLSPHSFRVTTITDLLEQGVPLEDGVWVRGSWPEGQVFYSKVLNAIDVQRLAGHADPRTTRLYDRRDKKITRNIVERISI